MTKVIGGIALLLLTGGTRSSANAAPSGCVFYDGSTYNCSFYSYEQCYETAFGGGGGADPIFSKATWVASLARRGTKSRAAAAIEADWAD